MPYQLTVFVDKTTERIYDGHPTHTVFMGECILIHIMYSLHPYNEGIHTCIDTRFEEHMSHTCHEPQVIAQCTSYVSPLYIIEDKDLYTIVNDYHPTIVDITLRDL